MMRSRLPVCRSTERGFALLVVMLLAAAVAFSLYTQVPRFAFESMRAKEQMLMDRGNQYKRAIQVFYAVNKHYPARIEDLENTNDKRFLRRRYKDPMTGSDEWRLIHTNGTTLTDSLVQKPAAQNAANGTPGAGILPGGGPLGTNDMNTAPGQNGANTSQPAAFPGQPGAGQTGAFPGQPVGLPGQPNAQGTAPTGTPDPSTMNPAALRRPSDRLNPGDGTATPVAALPADNPLIPGLYPPGYNPATYNPNDPSTWPPITLAPVNPQTGQPAAPGQTNTQGQAGQNAPSVGIPGFTGQNPLGQQPVTQISAQQLGGQQLQNVQPTPLPFGPQPNPGGDNSNGAAQANAGQAQTGIPGQGAGVGGANPQPFNPQTGTIFNPGIGFAGNPLAPDSGQQAGANPTAGNPPGVTSPPQLNPALQAINNQLSTPTGPPAVPATNAQLGAQQQASPGIAGVASKFEGNSIKIYNKRSKYKEWEFVFDPSSGAQPGQAATGQNAAGQPGQAQGQQGSQGANGGMFSLSPNPFGATPGQTNPAPSNAAPAPSPFGQPNPFGPTQ
jgi:hypothetical protein